jgi:hypothetical protein
VVNQIKPKYSPETLAVIGKLKFFGHIMNTSDSLEKDVMFGLTDITRRRETVNKMDRQNTRNPDNELA